MIGGVTAAIIEPGFDFAGELGVKVEPLSPALSPLVPRGEREKKGPREVEYAQRISGILRTRPKGGARFERMVGAIFKKLVLARGHDDEVRAILKDFLDDG